LIKAASLPCQDEAKNRRKQVILIDITDQGVWALIYLFFIPFKCRKRATVELKTYFP